MVIIFDYSANFRLKGIDVGKFNQNMIRKYNASISQLRPEMRRIFFPLKQESFIKARQGLLSFAFVREPFERLASAYWDKMDRHWSMRSDYKEMRDEILKK